MPRGTRTEELPVAIIGAGPVGLTAALHVAERGMRPLILEAGEGPGTYVRDWAHVGMFSPWEYNVDPLARRVLGDAGWAAPPDDELPTGAELVERLIEPLADLPAIRSAIRYGRRVVGVSRSGIDKLSDRGREDAPFVIHSRGEDGVEERFLASAVIDASGTWGNPNPLGSAGLSALGEAEHGDLISRRIPDVSGAERGRYAGRRVLVVGAGDSALNALLDLCALAEQEPATEVVWALRGSEPRLGNGAADQLPARGSLGSRVRELVASGAIEVVPGFRTEALEGGSGALRVQGRNGTMIGIDEIIAVTGFRPDLDMLRELRLAIDPAVESPTLLAPLIDPNVHSCGTVPPHGFAELSHPEPGFFIVGMKSYGRAPTFLLRTGYEQVRSVVAALAGDLDSARDVELVLPETGVCGVA
ncbi:MAG: FAD-dependent oxidoreductase [Gemmatimonadota bacterium]